MSQFFATGGQAIGVSASTSILPMNTQDWSPLGWTGWISLQSKGLSRVISNTTVQKASILRHSAFFIVQLSHPYTLKQCYKMFIIAFPTYFNKMEIKSFCFLPQNIHPITRHLEITFKLLIAITHVLKYYASLSLVFLSKRSRVYSTAKGKQQKRVLIKYQLICFLCMSH